MAIQTATTGQLENAQRIIIGEVRYASEHNAPCVNLIEHFTLKQGEKQYTVPFVGQMEMDNLVDGAPMVNPKDIGMTTVDLTTGEAGLFVVLTDKLLRQEATSPFQIVGQQMGDAKARKQDRDVIALFAALNSGTVFGADNKNMTLANVGACIANAKSKKFPSPMSIVHHPNAVYALTTAMTITPGSTYPFPKGFSEDLLSDFYRIKLNQIPIFEDGNIDKLSGYDSGYGAIFSKSAMCIVESQAPDVRRQEDILLRGWIVRLVCDYGVFELDDTQGAPLQYEISDPSTSA